ncbi:hypothetical protein AND_007960 [Anopheles darlingi]|uniref:Secreted protein n=1 Tax=Anopheles darlingi TaxID=43151 RepID=W5JC37_ANODA|nr:hypothetical protein AND_007960 [Anopheles darlingi]
MLLLVVSSVQTVAAAATTIRWRPSLRCAAPLCSIVVLVPGVVVVVGEEEEEVGELEVVTTVGPEQDGLFVLDGRCR